MIIGWKIIKINKEDKSFVIKPIIRKDKLSEEIHDLWPEEYNKLTIWGFLKH